MKGFTLIEVLIVAAVGAITGALLLQLFIQNSGLTFQQNAKVSQGIDLNDASSIVSNDIKQAASVASGYPVSSPTINSGTGAIVLKIPSIDSSGNVIDSTFDYTVVNWLNSSYLQEDVHPDPSSSRRPTSKIIIKNVNQFNLTYMDGNGNPVSPSAASKVKFLITTKQRAALDNPTASTTETVSLRNN